MPRAVTGHAIVSADGLIADEAGAVPEALRVEADWRRFQAALDAAALVALGRMGHRRAPNPGRRRLVATRGVRALEADPLDPLAWLWNPAAVPFEVALDRLGVGEGPVAVAGAFDLFLPHLTAFDLAECHGVVLGRGMPCFAAGHPRAVLAAAGHRPVAWEALEPGGPGGPVTLARWARG